MTSNYVVGLMVWSHLEGCERVWSHVVLTWEGDHDQILPEVTDGYRWLPMVTDMVTDGYRCLPMVTDGYRSDR